MELKKRNWNVDVEVEILAKRWQRISMTINGERHEHVASAAVSNMFGDLVDVLYELYIEANDDSRPRWVKYLSENEETHIITGVTAQLDWDNEGEITSWRFSRQLYTEEKMLQLEVDYDYGERVCKYSAPFFDMCYAVARAATEVLKKTGVIGYHFLGETDRIDIHHLLYIKHLGLFREPIPYYPFDGHENDRYTSGDKVTSFADEMNLLQFEM